MQADIYPTWVDTLIDPKHTVKVRVFYIQCIFLTDEIKLLTRTFLTILTLQHLFHIFFLTSVQYAGVE